MTEGSFAPLPGQRTPDDFRGVQGIGPVDERERIEVTDYPPPGRAAHRTGDQSGCASARQLQASSWPYLEVLRRENLLENVRAPGGHLLAGLADLQRSTSLIADVRGLGLILGMEMAATPRRR